jgi:hypothetical protein
MTLQTHSAIESVVRSDWELVPRRKRKGKLASARDLAKLDWQPWEHHPKAPPSRETMERLGAMTRFAYLSMGKSRK